MATLSVPGKVAIFLQIRASNADLLLKLMSKMEDMDDRIMDKMDKVEGRVMMLEGEMSKIKGEMSKIKGEMSKMDGRLNEIQHAQEFTRKDIQGLTEDAHRKKVVERLGACFGTSTLVDSIEKIISPYLEIPDINAGNTDVAMELHSAIRALLAEVAGTGTFLHITWSRQIWRSCAFQCSTGCKEYSFSTQEYVKEF
jgi:predicted nuclease with TOPRIM domain